VVAKELSTVCSITDFCLMLSCNNCRISIKRYDTEDIGKHYVVKMSKDTLQKQMIHLVEKEKEFGKAHVKLEFLYLEFLGIYSSFVVLYSETGEQNVTLPKQQFRVSHIIIWTLIICLEDFVCNIYCRSLLCLIVKRTIK
jgi:hypothetical protein